MDAIEVPAVENAPAVEVATVELVAVPAAVEEAPVALRRGLRGRSVAVEDVTAVEEPDVELVEGVVVVTEAVVVTAVEEAVVVTAVEEAVVVTAVELALRTLRGRGLAVDCKSNLLCHL